MKILVQRVCTCAHGLKPTLNLCHVYMQKYMHHNLKLVCTVLF